MPYTHYNTDERNALQAMEGMGLPKRYSAVILDKHLSSVYRELDRNSSGGVYTGNESQRASVQRRLENKPGPKLDDSALTREIMGPVVFLCLWNPREGAGMFVRPDKGPGRTGRGK